MKHQFFIDRHNHRLLGKGALIQPHPTKRWWVLAQFDDTELLVDPTGSATDITNRLGYGWHPFVDALFANQHHNLPAYGELTQ